MSKEIDNFFSDKMGDEITKELKAKRKKYNSKLITKAIALTLAILMILGLLVNVVSDKVLQESFHKQSAIFYKEYTVMHPTEYIGERKYLETGLFKSLTFFNIGKVIGGRVVDSGTETLVSGLQFGKVGSVYLDYKDYYIDQDISKRSYNTNGLRELNFMLPYVNYENVINDFKYLDQIDNDKYVEMVISFDKEYSYEEVNKNFDSNKVSFYWINISRDEAKVNYEENKGYLTENEVMGIKSITANGKVITDKSERLKEYKEAITYLKDNKYKGIIEDVDENYTNISGIVVQGTSDELKELKDNIMIKHAILGNVVDSF